MLADVEATLGEDLASPRAQALTACWWKLVERFTGGDPEIQKGLNAMWADKPNRLVETGQRFEIRPEVQAFITKAMQLAMR